jgi:hypothetical protein
LRTLGAILMLALVASCTSSSTASFYVPISTLPELGSPFVPREPAIATVSRGRTRHTFGVLFQESRLHVMVDAADDRVVHISTSDPRFSTPEGARVGDTVSRITALGGRWIETDTSYLLSSGWQARFGSDHTVFLLERNPVEGVD